jgi:hypothetical protein
LIDQGWSVLVDRALGLVVWNRGPFWRVKGLLVAAALVVLAVIVVVLAVLVLGYNGLVRQRDRVDSAWSQVDLQLRRRSELIPSLVETVDDHAGYERGTLEAVTEARARAIGAHGPVEQASAESALTGALMSLFAVVESYPDLRASQGFVELQRELSATRGSRRLRAPVLQRRRPDLQQRRHHGAAAHPGGGVQVPDP